MTILSTSGFSFKYRTQRSALSQSVMAFKFYLGVRTTPGSYKRVTVDDINPNAKIGDLKVEAGKVTNLPMESLELAYCGNVLEDDLSVTECGLKSGVTVHVLRKHIPNDFSKQTEPISEAQIKAVSQAFRTISLDPAFRNALQMMKQPSHIENLVMITPALLNDPVALAIVQDPELIVRMADFATAKRMAELHPALAETANHIAGAVQVESAQPSAPSALNYSDNSYSYAMDDFSDEEEMDSSQSSDSIAGNSSRGGRSQITAPQLAAALASARGSYPPVPGNSGTPQASTSSGTSSATPPVITPEMLQNAIASFTPPDNSSPMLMPPLPSGFLPHNNRNPTQQQIQQMRDVGLQDDVVNLHALAITGGDVQAAINLVLSGVIAPEDDF